MQSGRSERFGPKNRTTVQPIARVYLWVSEGIEGTESANSILTCRRD